MENQTNTFISTVSSGTTVNGWITSAPLEKKTNSYFNGKSISIIKGVRIFGLFLKKKVTEVSVEEFFNLVKMDKLKLKIVKNVLSQYELSIQRAEIAGQEALAEKLRDNVEIVKREIEAIIAGIDKYITVEQFEDLKKKATRGIEVTPIKNFTRHIPDKVIEKIASVRSKNVFDEFVVVHYDPQKKAVEMTKKEIAKKKDPIVFGLIRDSGKMYFIADWIDEYCNLTLEEVVKITGRKAGTLISK